MPEGTPHMSLFSLISFTYRRSRALLLVTLYGCTDSSLYQRMAHELVDPWMEEASPKRSKTVLIRRLRDYDRWFGHGNGDK